MTTSWTTPKPIVPVVGRWRIDDGAATYEGPSGAGASHPFGIGVSDASFRAGRARVAVRLDRVDPATDPAARILLGYRSPSDAYLTVGLGGYGGAFVVALFEPTIGWVSLTTLGNRDNLVAGREYALEVQVRGQRLTLSVDGVRVIAIELRSPLPLGQLGLFTWGTAPVSFSNFGHALELPRAFVVMQFSEPFHALYEDVIRPIAKAQGFDAFHVGEVSGPGLILQDITQSIVEADVVIADITPANQNVFYELGYAHALKKPTVLLAERGKQLPFDVSGYRCLMYDNTIAGKKELEEGLNRHLRAINEGRS